jgi:hypothetical protein
MYRTLAEIVASEIQRLRETEKFELGAALERRVEKFSKMGVWQEAAREEDGMHVIDAERAVGEPAAAEASA